MAFRIKRGEKADRGLRRVMREQYAGALDALSQPEERRQQGIHDFRVSCKRLRSTLRLLEYAGYPACAGLRRGIGRLAAELGALRDADALLESLQALYLAHPDWFEGNSHEVARQILLREREQGRAQAPDYVLLATRLRRGMTGLSEQLGALELPHGKGRLRKACRRARKRMHRACINARPGHADDFHRWRKRVKDQLYQGQLLYRLLSKRQRKSLGTLDRLAHLLGEHHDLENMAQQFQRIRERGIPPPEGLATAISRQQHHLEKQSRALCRALSA